MQNNRTIADKARALAVEHHKNQPYSNLPFSHHLTAVAGLVALYTTDQITVAAAWLHDIVEDTKYTEVTLDDIHFAYGNEVAYLVDLLSDPADLPRPQAKAISVPRIAADERASLIKLADRYANQKRTIDEQNRRMAQIYLDEIDFLLATMYQHGRDSMPLFHMVSAQKEDLRKVAELRFAANS